MSKICPYCEKSIEIYCDEFIDGETSNQKCEYCGKVFAFGVKIVTEYHLKKAPCLNGGEHDWELSYTFPGCRHWVECKNCGKSRSCSQIELQELIK